MASARVLSGRRAQEADERERHDRNQVREHVGECARGECGTRARVRRERKWGRVDARARWSQERARGQDSEGGERRLGAERESRRIVD